MTKVPYGDTTAPLLKEAERRHLKGRGYFGSLPLFQRKGKGHGNFNRQSGAQEIRESLLMQAPESSYEPCKGSTLAADGAGKTAEVQSGNSLKFSSGL